MPCVIQLAHRRELIDEHAGGFELHLLDELGEKLVAALGLIGQRA